MIVTLFMGACTEPGHLAIVTELMTDSVHNILHKRKSEMSLPQKVKMAKDTAAGMAWLHGASPQILHRDVCPSILYIVHIYMALVLLFGY